MGDACRAGSTTLYPFGDDMSKLGDHAWYESNSGLKTRLPSLTQFWA